MMKQYVIFGNLSLLMKGFFMKAVLSVLTTSAIAILLACAGCEPEPQAQPTTEVMQQEAAEIPESAEQPGTEPEKMTEQVKKAEEIVEDI